MNILLVLQYTTLNGYLIHHSFLKKTESSALETILSAFLISVSTNSLLLYIAIRIFKMPFTTNTIWFLTITLAGAIVAIGHLTMKIKK